MLKCNFVTTVTRLRLEVKNYTRPHKFFTSLLETETDSVWI